ncbi:MAG: 2-C-methyl-D-erythritol 4-phosphate cytidylyltransferase [Pseudomonadota bacterium]
MPNVMALLVAAGRGSRMGDATGGSAKQYAALDHLSVLTHALEALLEADEVTGVQVVIHPDDDALYKSSIEALGPAKDRIAPPVTGGETRQASTHNGLHAIASLQPDLVLIHDAARPFLPGDVIRRVIAGCVSNDGAIPGLPSIDTVKQVDRHGVVVKTLPRDTLLRVQTPQAFHFAALLDAHEAVAHTTPEQQAIFTDDASIMEAAGHRVIVVEGDERLRKITTPEDLMWARQQVAAGLPEAESATS